MEAYVKNIDITIESLFSLLSIDSIIAEDSFFESVGIYSKQLKEILSYYFTLEETERYPLQPYLNYYRQLQGYLVFILRFPDILQVPHHSEIEQTLEFISKKDELIENFYTKYSNKERTLLHGSFKEQLEKLWGGNNNSQ
jgi:hypothetical protein